MKYNLSNISDKEQYSFLLEQDFLTKRAVLKIQTARSSIEDFYLLRIHCPANGNHLPANIR